MVPDEASKGLCSRKKRGIFYKIYPFVNRIIQIFLTYHKNGSSIIILHQEYLLRLMTALVC